MYNFFTQFPTFLKQFNWKNNKINKNEENEEYIFQLYTSKWERKGKIEINIRKAKKKKLEKNHFYIILIIYSCISFQATWQIKTTI